MLNRIRARAEQQGWAWPDVLAKVRQQLGLTEDYFKPESREQTVIDALRSLQEKNAQRQKLTDEQNAKIEQELASKRPAPAPEVETDPARRQEILNSIAEGNAILKSGRNIAGRRLSKAQLEGVERSVENAKAKLAAEPPLTPPAPADSVSRAGRSAAETITGSNERTGSEMPAEREERLTPKPRPLRKTTRADQGRPWDLIDEIQGTLGKINLRLIREANPNFKPRGVARKLFTTEGGTPADVAATQLREAGIYKGDAGQPDQLGQAINDAAAGRIGWRKQFHAEERDATEAGRQASNFEKKVIEGQRPKQDAGKVERVDVGELLEGDTFEVQGNRFEVSQLHFDEDTGELAFVEVKDGPKFGVQRIYPDGTEVIHIDKGSMLRPESGADASTDFLGAEDLAPPAPAPKGPKLGQGQNQGDLIASTQREDLALVGDRGTDFERLAAAKEQAARDAAEAKAKADREQGDMFGASSGAEGTRSQAYPGGPLGEGPARPADNPSFSQFPMELPEAVKFARELAGGVYPKLRDRLRLLGGTALGVFKHRDAAGKASIELRRDLFDLPESERARLREEALNYAKAAADKPAEVKAIFQERLDYLKREAFKENPLLALKVLWHEIGHWVDWLPDHMIQGRGNLFGRLASLKGYLEHTLPEAPGVPNRKIEPAERAKLQREAERALREELGPIEEIVRTIVTEEPIYERAGVTPEDVKNLLGMNAREANPELYRWFAEQPAEVKKAILKAAMKGMVDARVANQGATLKQTGTRKVEREVREKVGREPTPAEIKERFQKLFREELARRRLAELEQVKAEIEPLIAWWRGTEKMEDYFKPSAEMYAEAFSIFANNPAAMAQRAPTYWRILNSYFGRKPEVAKLYREIQDSLAAGTVMRDRVTDLRRSWREDDAQSMDRARKQDRISAGAFLDNVLYHFDDRLGPVYRVARQAGQRGAPLREAAGNYRYRATEHERLLGRANREVIEPLAAAGVDRVWLEEYIFHKHVTESRFVRDPVTKELRMIGNPMGWTPKNSLERLAEMKQQLGPENFAKLEAAQQTWRRIYEEQVLNLVKRSGLASPELMQAMEERVFYATFAKAKGEPAADGIAQLLEDSYGPQVGSHIYRQVGNLGEIKAPFTGTVLKSLALTSAAYRNILKRETVRAMLANDRGNIAEARVRWNGKRIEPVIVGGKGSKVGTLVYLDQGKVKAYYVPKAVADGIDGGAGHDNQLALASMKSIGALKAVFTQLNYGFWPVALVRDAAAWTMQLPGAGPLDLAKNFGPALKAAYQSQRGGQANPLADAALRRKMLISRADSRGVMNNVDNEFDLKVASFGLDPVKWGEQDRQVTKLVRAWNHYREFGQVFERTMKIAGMRYLDAKFPEMPEWQKQELVRERAGSPDFLTKGAAAPIVDWAAMFYNPWLQGVKAVGKAARENPFSFAAKATALVVAPTVMQSLAVRGMLGDDLKEMYGSVSDYDLTNYLVVPLGWHDRERKKVAYLRLPLWEPARLAHGSLFQSLTGRGQGVLSFAGGQLPGLNPLLANAAMWWDYTVNHRNPYDSFHGRLLLTDDAFKVGGAAAYEELAKQTWNSLGGSIVARFDGKPLGEPEPERLEKFLKLPLVSNALGRWVKVSNRGVFDADRKAAESSLQADAQRREAVRVAVDATMAGKAFTESERMLLRDPAAADYYLKLLKKAHESRAALDQQRQQRLPTKGAREAAFAPVP
jgi:hypothetical protein